MSRRKLLKNDINDLDRNEFIPKEIEDKVMLWSLRLLLKFGGHNELIDKDNYIRNDSMALFLGIGEYIYLDRDSYTRSEVIAKLETMLKKYESKKRFSTLSIFAKNIKQLSNLMKLSSHEIAVLEFVFILHQFDLFREIASFLGNSLNSSQIKNILHVVLNIPSNEITAMFKGDSNFSKSSLISFYKRNTNDLKGKLEAISDSFVDDMVNYDGDIVDMIKDSIRRSSSGKLTIKDYSHIKKDIDILVPYIQQAISTKQIGVNVLLYGLPGTGKTELAKTIAQHVKSKLFEISYADEDDEPIDGIKRVKAFKIAQSLLANEKTILMYDEAEDIFESNSGGFFSPPKRQRDKAWINKILETNSIPTFWITNNINSIDTAIARRFDLCIELPIPPKNKRTNIINEYSQNLLQSETIKLIATNNDIAPALISNTAKVVASIPSENNDEVFKHILNNTLKAQGYNEIEKGNLLSLPNTYNPMFINTSVNLEDLSLGIKESANARLCLYGPAGTGKSAYGKYIAERLNKPLILKKASDLQSKWIGECEKNIALAFEEAKQEGAVLIFDEVDSFLQDRSKARASWEISQVNELLVQMENFDGIFIATTNLMDNLDSASLRRFDLKLEFGYLKEAQAYQLLLVEAKQYGFKVDKSVRDILKQISHIAPGDFAAIRRQNRFRPLRNSNDLIERLQAEVKIKNIATSKKMGFVV